MTQLNTHDVIVDGSEDKVQLTVQGNSTQTQPLQEWQDSAGIVLVQVTEDGRVQVGDGGMSTSDALIEAHRDENSPLPQRGVHSLGKIASVITTAIAWMVSELELVGTNTISSIHAAVRGRLTHSSTGDSTNAELRAGDFEVINQSGTTATPVGGAVGLQGTVDNQQNAYLTKASGVVAQIQNATGADIETATALEVGVPVNDGTIDTLIGVDIPDITQGTENYALRTGAGLVHLGDVVEIDPISIAPNAKAGVTQLYSKSDGKLYAKDPADNEYDLTQTGGGGSANVMTGATSSVDGAEGLAPQPLAGDEGKFLKGDGTWDVVSTVGALNDLTDVDTTGVGSGDVLSFDGTDWSTVTPDAGADILSDLTDVNTAGATNGDVLKFDGTDWLPAVDETSSPMTGATASVDGVEGLAPQPLAGDEGKFLKGDGTWDVVSAVGALNDLTDVDTTGVASGDVLSFDGTDWSPTTPSAGGGAFLSGMIIPYGGNSAPTNWFMCDGTAISRTTYSDLFTAIGTTYGTGDGSTTFNIPDMRGRVAVGSGTGSGLTSRVLGSSFGEEDHQLTISEMPSHKHVLNYVSEASTGGSVAQSKIQYGRSSSTHNYYNTDYGMQNNGSDNPHNNMQPSIALNYIIKI